MKQVCNTPRIMLSASGSGCGKTTMTAALLGAFHARGMHVQSYKSGPDYIDPMFHTHITGRETYHTDPFFSDQKKMCQIIGQSSINADLIWMEGAMGFYDGIGQTAAASAYTVSEWTETPVLLLLYPQGMGCSIAAVCKGFLEFLQPNRICGIVLNRIRSGMYSYYKQILERETDMHVYGYLPELPQVHLESRHLGLMTAGEVKQLDEKIHLLVETAEETLDLDGILTLAAKAPALSYESDLPLTVPHQFRLGVAQDTAFCFTYAENLDLLRQCGAEIVPFSPLFDTALPPKLDGIYLCGGYPELYLRKLSENHMFIQSLRNASKQGMPIFAECGGFLYLQEMFCDTDGTAYPMAGLLPGTARLGTRLCRFGYVTLTAQEDTILGEAGMTIRAHEFHYADSSVCGTAFCAERPNGKQWTAYQSTANIAAGFPHLYFPSNPEVPKYFSAQCCRFQERRRRI